MANSFLTHPHEDQYRFVLNAAGVGVWHFAIDTREFDCSEMCKVNFGRPADEPFTFEELETCIFEEDLEKWREAIAAAIRNRSDFDHQYRIRRPGGDIRWIHSKGRLGVDAGEVPTHLSGICRDVTTQKRLRDEDEALLLTQKHLAFAVTASEIGTWHITLPEQKFTANSILCEHFWKPYEESPDINTFFSSMHVEDEHRVRAAVEECMRDRRDYDVEYRTVSPTGTVRWIRALGKTFTDSDGVPRNFAGITWDITELKAMQVESGRVFEAERYARQQAEMASQLKDDFLATLSHELRTPLNAILGWTQILSTGPNLDEDTRTGLATIERNARAQTRIIEDLLDMSRIISGKVRLDVQTLNLASVVNSALETVRPAAEAKGVKLETGLKLLTKSINGDPNRLQQVFWNLLSNAVKFSNRGGEVKVEGHCVDSLIEIAIIDTGVGIAPEFLPHVFDRFRQADGSMTREHGGLGLGLAIVKQLVELHGGKVLVRSDGLGCGSVFVVSLPISAIQSEDFERPPVPEVEFSEPFSMAMDFDLTGITVLVVDDEFESRALMERLLRTTRATVVTADSALTAFEILKETKPNVLVSDIGMAGETGYGLIARVRALKAEEGGHVPAIALTAYARSDDRSKALLAGFQMHVAKPVEATEFLAAITSLAGRVHTATEVTNRV